MNTEMRTNDAHKRSPTSGDDLNLLLKFSGHIPLFSDYTFSFQSG